MNNASTIFLLLILLTSCIGEHQSNSQHASINAPSLPTNRDQNDTLKVDLASSSIHWKGTKMGGLGKHEGKIQLQDAFFLTNSKGALTGGLFTANMNSIEVTDIPEHEPVPRQRFNNHMKSEDFFDSENYPTSKFEITNIQEITMDSLLVVGNLTIKNISKSVTFTAVKKRKAYTARFTFNRFEWNIAYDGNWIDKTLVDKDIELIIKLVIY